MTANSRSEWALPGFSGALPTEIWSRVEVRQCPPRSGAHSCDPRLPKEKEEEGRKKEQGRRTQNPETLTWQAGKNEEDKKIRKSWKKRKERKGKQKQNRRQS